jgi:cyclopropane fatty-acyl-phospholipid synthase-like methyltransferase
VLRLLKLQPDHIVADIGSATGYFTVRIARAVPRGHVYGFDLEPNMVRYLNARARRENLSNLTAHLAKPSGIAPPRKLDRVFTCNTYHHIRKRVVYFKKLAAHLEPGALVMVVDFKQGPLPVGPPESHRVKLATLAKELTAAGYSRVTHDRTTLPHQWVALYKR